MAEGHLQASLFSLLHAGTTGMFDKDFQEYVSRLLACLVPPSQESRFGPVLRVGRTVHHRALGRSTSRGVPVPPVAAASRRSSTGGAGRSPLGVGSPNGKRGLRGRGATGEGGEHGHAHYVPQLFCHVPVKSPELSTLETTML